MITTEESAGVSKGTWATREAKVYGLFEIAEKTKDAIVTTKESSKSVQPQLKEVALSTNV
jgi:hypothetical protein